MKTKKKYYAYFISEKKRGIVDSWKKCEKLVSRAKNARYRGFSTQKEAEHWLARGAAYEAKKLVHHGVVEPGIYFDAGTGRGEGVEISVTDERGRNLLHTALPKEKINIHGKHLLSREMTNNYGELLACFYALEIAMAMKQKRVFGDSQLILKYWSKGFIKHKELPPITVALADSVRELRKKFEAKGGELAYISGDHNPADLGFHR